ncbi:MAG: hypothetical protein ACHQQQ_05745 [Bacteroidota bacterium]
MNEHPSPALVLSGGGWPGAYDIVRALGREGIRSVVASSQTDEIAFSSRYTLSTIKLPPFMVSHYNEILAFLTEFGSQCSDKPVLYYVGDSELDFVSHHEELLNKHFRFLLPSRDILENVIDKGLFVDLAKHYDLPIPRTRNFADIDDLKGALDTIALPCIVKPVHNIDWFMRSHLTPSKIGSYKEALRRFNSRDELRRFCSELPSRTSRLIVQSYIEGGEESVVCFNGYFDDESQCLGYLTGREIRTNPPINGESAYSETTDDAELSRLSIEYLQRLKFHGIVKIDYKWDAITKRFIMIEIEPHYQFWHLLGAYGGVNLPYIAYCHQRGERVENGVRCNKGERMLYFKHDFAAYIRFYRKMKGWTFVAYVKTLFRRQHYRVFDTKDPLPFIRSVVGFLFKTILDRN